MTSTEIAKKLSIASGTVTKTVKMHDLETDHSGGYHKCKYKLSDIVRVLSTHNKNSFNERFLEAPATKLYDDFWKLDWSEFIVGCDTHIPFVYEKIWNRMLEMALKYQIPNFIHAGDFWNQDQFTGFDIDPADQIQFHDEIDAGRKAIKTLKQAFKNIYFFMGSHDVRFWLNSIKQQKPQDFDTPFSLTGEKDGIHVSKYRYAEIGDEWRLNHPKNIVKVGGLPSVRLAAKHNRSVVFGHGHWWGMNRDPSGKHYLVAPGCLVDKRKIAYKNVWDTSHDEWVNGFLMVRDKVRPTLLAEDSDWNLYLH